MWLTAMKTLPLASQEASGAIEAYHVKLKGHSAYQSSTSFQSYQDILTSMFKKPPDDSLELDLSVAWLHQIHDQIQKLVELNRSTDIGMVVNKLPLKWGPKKNRTLLCRQPAVRPCVGSGSGSGLGSASKNVIVRIKSRKRRRLSSIRSLPPYHHKYRQVSGKPTITSGEPMAEIDVGHQANVEDQTHPNSCFPTVQFLQKLIAEVVGTYFVIFAGCAAVVVNADKEKVVSLPGISIVWGLVVMVMVYSVGHISGAHFNPAVTIAFASCNRFPMKQVPAYVSAQVLGSTLASGTLRLIFNGSEDHFAGTLPAGSHLQSLILEFIITFYLMFVISGVATDNRAANIRGINEPSKEFRSRHSVEPIPGHMDLHVGSNHRCHFRCMGLQHCKISGIPPLSANSARGSSATLTQQVGISRSVYPLNLMSSVCDSNE
ncbi:hypothetical protein E3N88_44542 [Mikania micrantha]|uniref:Aquaporin n=1 Tax=Mikania micrantha TaxID=192012 RepID=A0A5N6LBQ0_9ASTR|nr:hypothetical protein E3N88_44542 [Mikania micrantha]